jgi:hypothetical protein
MQVAELLKTFQYDDRIELIPDQYRVEAKKVFEYIRKEANEGKNVRETDLINRFKLQKRRYVYHGVIASLASLQLIKYTGKAGRVRLFTIVAEGEAKK